MHNKSFTVDGEVTIIGGRNVGDAYFGAGEQPLFSDLDVLAIGPVVEEVTQDFERYWRSRSVSTLDNVLDVEAEEIDARVQLPPHWKDDPVAQSVWRVRVLRAISKPARSRWCGPKRGC